MTDTEKFFSSTTELQTIYRWARARFAAPWAVFGAVLLRVAASTGPHVQLPGVIGGRASLNMITAFVSASGGGKGISDKVARMAWPSPILERPIGSGEGIAALFAPPKKEGVERVTRAIINVTEIDTLSGIAARQGSILLAQLKAAVMGELIGQSNASEATSRVVQPHSYRCCMSIGAQPGHTSVIFNDATGGTPQRILWFLTTDPDMPAEAVEDPEPLNCDLPAWSLQPSGIQTPSNELVDVPTEIAYGPSEIAETIVQAHLARQRGEADALDGHRMLTRCKVAATLAIMHHRVEVSELDWQLSDEVMTVSDATRDWIVEQARRSVRAKVRDRAVARAVGEEFYDASRLESVKRSLLRMLERDGEQAGGDLRRRLGKREKRELFDQAISLLETDGLVSARPGEHNSLRYRIGSPVTTGVTPQTSSSDGVTYEVTRDHPATVTDLDTRRSYDSDPPKRSCPQWFNNYIADLQAAGYTTTTAFAAIEAGMAQGYSKGVIRQAASNHPDVHTLDRKGGTATWSIVPGAAATKPVGAADWTANYIDGLARDCIAVVNKDEFRKAGEAAGYSWTSLRHAATDSTRIKSVPSNGSETIWQIQAEESTA